MANSALDTTHYGYFFEWYKYKCMPVVAVRINQYRCSSFFLLALNVKRWFWCDNAFQFSNISFLLGVEQDTCNSDSHVFFISLHSSILIEREKNGEKLKNLITSSSINKFFFSSEFPILIKKRYLNFLCKIYLPVHLEIYKFFFPSSFWPEIEF